MIYDFDTKNKSFIKVAKQLKDEGIKNYKFHLILYDASLKGVDPHDEANLTLEQKTRILKEVRINPWYYLRECVRIPESGGSIAFQAHRGNIAQSFCIFNNIDVIECLPRQNGKTIGAVSDYSWIYHFSTINTNMLFSNKQLADSQLNIKRFNDITDALPKFMLSHLNDKLDTNNLNNIRCNATNNTITAMSTAKDEASADKLGRGCTVPIIWYDEFAFLKFNKKVFDSAAFALSKASESAKRNGTPYSRLITTTPNNLDSDEGLYCYTLIQEAVPFDEHWYDLPIEKVKQIIADNSENDFVFIQYDYKQLGHDEKWLTKQKRLVGNDLLTIKREIFLEWTLSGDTSPFSEEQLTILEKYKKKPIASFYIKNVYKFDILEDLYNMRNRNYIISIDIAGGLEKDATAITVIDPLTYKPVVVFKSNRIDTPTLVDVVEELIEMYFNEGIIVPERNNMGLSVIQMMLKRPTLARNLYYEKKKRTTEREVNLRGKTKKETKEVRVYGIDTTAKSREFMVKEILNMIVDERPELIISENIFNEIKTLERKKNGKIEHKDGCHDDCLMSYLVGMYMILYGNNTGKFIKVTHRNVFNEEDGQIDSAKNRIKSSINTLRMNVSDDVNLKQVNDFLNQYKKITIDTTNHGQVSSNRPVRNSKVVRNIGFINSMNR